MHGTDTQAADGKQPGRRVQAIGCGHAAGVRAVPERQQESAGNRVQAAANVLVRVRGPPGRILSSLFLLFSLCSVGICRQTFSFNIHFKLVIIVLKALCMLLLH